MKIFDDSIFEKKNCFTALTFYERKGRFAKVGNFNALNFFIINKLFQYNLFIEYIQHIRILTHMSNIQSHNSKHISITFQ